MTAHTTRRRRWAAAGAALAASVLLSACTSNTPEPVDGDGGGNEVVGGGANDETGESIRIGFSAPAADHGWMGAITKAALAEAERHDDVELVVAEATNDVSMQISHIEGFINDGVDAIVLLPFDGAALTEIAIEAMEAGIPVINVDREFSSPFAARSTVLGDNYGMGVSAGTYICEELGGESGAVVAEIAGIDSLPLTQDRSKGFADALADCGLEVSNRVAADFTVAGGQQAAANLLQAAPEIDAIWNHDDDQGVGVLAAIEEANRDEFIMVGGAGSANVMRAIEADDSVLKATVVYPSTQAADGVRLARLIAHGKAMGDLVEVEVPRTIQLFAPVVTKANVDDYLPTAFES
ncbi:MAG: substrate-binding domain-containing protein [Cellulomonas sp.]|jgi:ribose transport system substrate-binding protein|uniref:substrate-binding domain-containing protein n=1 Tax=Cellulomonas sp. TaxID=40001 RepID=UPI0019F5D04E|nr:substrate-binding domain-containing protein [Cellulomonas sp.]MBF0689675.1 substrate-binding domain-containing protein [Cellulomonas sp.]